MAESFSPEWHQWFAERFTSAESPLNEIEIQLRIMSDTLSKLRSLQTDHKWFVERFEAGPRDISDALRGTTFLIDFLRRKTLLRSVELGRGFIDAMNAQNYALAPLVLRGILEEGCVAIYSAETIRNNFGGLADGEGNEEEKWDRFYGSVLRPLFSSRVDSQLIRRSLFRREMDELLSPSEIVYRKIGFFIAAADENRLDLKPQSGESDPLTAVNILTAIKQASKVLTHDGKLGGENWLYAFYAYLSNQCHPSEGSWQYLTPQVIEGAEFSWTDDLREETRQVAHVALTGLGSHIFRLPLVGYERLSDGLAEVSRVLNLSDGTPFHPP